MRKRKAAAAIALCLAAATCLGGGAAFADEPPAAVPEAPVAEAAGALSGAAEASYTEGAPVPATAERVYFNVHLLGAGKADAAMLGEMEPALVSADGARVEPSGIRDNGFAFEFFDVPEGEYTLEFSLPQGYRFAAGETGSMGAYVDSGSKVQVKAGNVVNNFYTRLESVPAPVDPAEPAPATAERVYFNVHLLVDGKRDYPDAAMLGEMEPALVSADGDRVEPSGIRDNGFAFEFFDVPEGEYTLEFSLPKGYRFAAGEAGSMGAYVDSGSKVQVQAGNVVNNFYTRLQPVPAPVDPADPTDPADPSRVSQNPSKKSGPASSVKALPKTGDQSGIAALAAAGAACAAAASLALARRARRDRESED